MAETVSEPIPAERVPALLAAAEADDDGIPRAPVMVLDLDGPLGNVAQVVTAIRDAEVVAVGIARADLAAPAREVAEALAFTFVGQQHSTDRLCVAVDDISGSLRQLQDSVGANPIAALAMRRLLESTSRLPVRQGLQVESAVYSMLLAGREFARWQAGRTARPVPTPHNEPVRLERIDDELRVHLVTPQRRNAFSRQVRDALFEAFDLALVDDTIEKVVLTSEGPAFCSGGDLDEFGSSSDVALAHVIRLTRSVALRAHALRDRLEVHLHGTCVGAGIEIPSFAGRVKARNDTVMWLPELAMGLVPGAGGTVGITSRIGRWRCAWMHLTGERIGKETALDWGLIDQIG